MAKAKFDKPSALQDLERRQKPGYNPGVLDKGGYPEPSDNGFVGVDPSYQNFANETERPFVADGGAESKVEARVLADEVDTSQGATPEGEASEEDEDEEAEEEEASSGPSTFSTPLTPPSGSGS